MSIIAIRRDLPAGAVFFRQIGNIVEYSLDMTIWHTAFILPFADVEAAPASYDVYIEQTIDQFITQFTSNFEINMPAPQTEGSITLANLNQVAQTGSGRMYRNLCAASRALAATFAAMVNVHLEDEADNDLNLIDVASNLASSALEIGLLIFGRGVGKIAYKWMAGVIVGDAAVGAGAAWYASLDNAADLTDCDVQQIACAIYRTVTTAGADKSSLAGALINEFDFTACPSGTMTTALTEWFSEWIEEWPELYTAFLAGLTDNEVIDCTACGGCEDVDLLRSDITHNGYWVHNAGIRSPRHRTAATNYKELSISIPVPNDLQNTQIDAVEFDYVFNRYVYGASFPVNPVEVVISGPFSQSASANKATFLTDNAGTYEADFTASNLAYGADTVTIRFRLTYNAANTNDPFGDVIITRVNICYRAS